MQRNPNLLKEHDDAEADEFLERHWSEISNRAARGAAKRIVWDRRIGLVNRFLIAAVLLMTLQMS